MSEQRKMTIARGLTRLKTIKAQLSNIANQVGQYGAINNKVRHPLGEQKASLDKNHNQAIDAVNALYQQFNDLIAEFTKIKLAIDKANLTTVITVAGKQMTIQEALIYRRDIQQYVQALNHQYGRAVQQAQAYVDKYNNGLNTEGMDEATLKAVMADILYLVPRERINEVNNFLVAFMTELDGVLNEVNAVTEITIE
jgi:hypothetical protein